MWHVGRSLTYFGDAGVVWLSVVVMLEVMGSSVSVLGRGEGKGAAAMMMAHRLAREMR